MSKTNDLQIMVGKQLVTLAQPENIPLSISYQLENPENFQEKGSSISLDIELPADNTNAKVFNSYHNPAMADMTHGQSFRGLLPCSIIAGGYELLKGVAQLKSATHTDRPGGYRVNCYGNNADWSLKMKEFTLMDGLSTDTHTFTKANVENSWNYNGTSASLDYVYAPVRYRKPFDSSDTIVRLNHMRPSLSIYWILQRAFQKIGYRIESTFMDSAYFRRLVMPWVWGDFLNINSKVADLLKFKATGVSPFTGSSYHDNTIGSSGNGGGIFNNTATGLFNTFTMENDFIPPGYDNGSTYIYHNSGTYNGAMVWTYPASIASQLGTITARFSLKVKCLVKAQFNSNATIYADVYKSGSLITSQPLCTTSAGTTSTTEDGDLVNGRLYNFQVTGLNANDNVVVYLRASWFKSSLGSFSAFVDSWNDNGGSTFELLGVEIEPGGVVNWAHYDKFRNYKLLDLLRGVMDAFDIVPTTDSVGKVVYLEPAFPYSPTNGVGEQVGHFNFNRLDWTTKQDLAKEAEMLLFDDTERDYLFSFKEDGSDGGLNKYTLRYATTPGAAKYRFPTRFKEGVKPYENRFFSPVMHFDAVQWRNITGVAPQLIALIPENVSNTSNDAAENAFLPKMVYYKGKMDRSAYGGWNWDGDTGQDLPFMFAVNYKYQGENDPVLTYNDQKINGNQVYGLLKRFYLQRLAIMRNGQLYNIHLHLNNKDITNWRHRERIILHNNAYMIIGIDSYKPLSNESTLCTMWHFWPREPVDFNNVYPSQLATMTQPQSVSEVDIKYKELLLINTDIPQ